MTQKIFISLVNWSNWEDTVKTITQLKNIYIEGVEIIIAVIDNASPNDSFEQLEKAFPKIKVIYSKENLGYAGGHRINYMHAKEMGADLFWILNSDLEIENNTLSKLLEAYHKKGDHIYGSVSVQPDNPMLVDFGGAKLSEYSYEYLSYNNWKGRKLIDLQKQFPLKYEVESVEGSSMLVPMSMIEKHGFMKTDFFMYGEETDYCYRMRKFGVRSFVVTDSVVKHHNEGSTNSYPSLKVIPAYYRRRNALRFSMEHLKMKRIEALGYKNGVFQNLKTWLKGKLSGKKDLNYFYALGCVHAFLNFKGKIIKPEKLID